MTDFSVNLNPLGPPPLIRERWGDLFRDIEPYPTVNGAGVARYYEKRYGIGPEEFVAGNGSTEMIYLLPRALGLRRVVVVDGDLLEGIPDRRGLDPALPPPAGGGRLFPSHG